MSQGGGQGKPPGNTTSIAPHNYCHWCVPGCPSLIHRIPPGFYTFCGTPLFWGLFSNQRCLASSRMPLTTHIPPVSVESGMNSANMLTHTQNHMHRQVGAYAAKKINPSKYPEQPKRRITPRKSAPFWASVLQDGPCVSMAFSLDRSWC